MPVHYARYVTGPRNPGGVDGMCTEPKCGAQASDPNDDPSAHDDLILAKFAQFARRAIRLLRTA
jgi:hypothetical protein